MTVAGRTIDEYRRLWHAKPALREVYADLYERMAAACLPGDTLEVGGGIGNFKQFAPEAISFDIQFVTWLDVVCDAHNLPFKSASFANIVMFDVLHHMERPAQFFREMQRVLKPGGRIVMVESAITPLSWIFYTYMHAEPCTLRDDPLIEGPLTPGRDPYDANQAIPTLLFGRFRRCFEALFPALTITVKRRMSIIAYPLSGGYKPWSLIPARLVRPILHLERLLMPVLAPLMAFRMFVVVEKSAFEADHKETSAHG